MLKKIEVAELCLGMHLHALEGAWLDHPFWKTRFVLSDPADLAALQASTVTQCWIDDAKGLDVEVGGPHSGPSPFAAADEAARSVAPAPVEAAPAPPAHDARHSLQDELARAALTVRQAGRAVRSLLSEARLGRKLDIGACAAVVGQITESVDRHPEALVSLARLKSHDAYSYLHSVAVCALMVSLARRLGQAEADVLDAGTAGLLHDMGKAMMPLDVLNKPGKLTAAEFAIMKAHPRCGHAMLQRGSAVPALALDVCLHHHERPDGKGYPFGLAGDALSLAARMGAVCDVYDAVTSNRPYKAGWDPAHSIACMADGVKAGQFDPAVFGAFVKILGIYPTGSLLRLRSGRLAVVVEQNLGALAQPKVAVFFSTRSQMPLPREVIDLSQRGASDSIAGRESNAEWKFSHLDELWAGRDALALTR